MFKQLVLCLVMIGALAACNGSDDPSTSTSTDGTSTGSTSTGTSSGGTGEAQLPPDTAPTLTGVPAPAVVAGTAYVFAPTANDANGDALTFSITNMPQWASFSTQTGELSGTPSTADVGVAQAITVTVSDGKETSSIGPFNITVTAPPPAGSNPTPPKNNPPVISGKPATSVTAGQTYSFTPTASDPDGNSLSFTIANMPSWATFSSTTGKLSGTPTTANIKTFTNIVISVSDGTASASLAPFSIQVTAPASSQTLQISGSPPTSVVAGTAYSFQPTTTDAPGKTLHFSVTNIPSWASLNTSTGALTGNPNSTQAGTYASLTLSVNDGTTTASLPTFSITVTGSSSGSSPPPTSPPPSNTPPTISGTPATAVTAGSTYSFTPTASDANGNTLAFSIQNKPSWATFSTASGNLSGTLGSGDVGTDSSITISVSDGTTSVALASFSIVVSAASSPATGTALITWVAPTQNSDGSALTNLTGFNIYYGTSAGSLTQVQSVSGATMTSYTINSLASGTWYFAVTALTSSGAESGLSNSSSKTIP